MIALEPFFSTKNGLLYRGDCLDVLPILDAESVDMVFLDPPFNLGKDYGSQGTDNKSDQEYVAWLRVCIIESVRLLRFGGSFFLYNLPKWNVIFGPFLESIGLTFRHWIVVNIKSSFPILGRLYPSHYSLLYYCKGDKPLTFKNIRTPISVCRHCGGEIKDYGGHRKSMHEKGVNLTDVWNDIPPVRHWKFKSKKRKANQLSTKLLTRVIEISTNPGDYVLDPFGGSGTTYRVCEELNRQWIGIELNDCEVIVDRLMTDDVLSHITTDYID